MRHDGHSSRLPHLGEETGTNIRAFWKDLLDANFDIDINDQEKVLDLIESH
jgi:hypothetical protein